MTGAPLPKGADCVIMVEHTEKDTNGKVIFTGKGTKANIAYQAEDVSKGDILIPAGTYIEPQHIAILAACGYAKPKVAVKPRVGIISTGDEIVEPSEQPGISKIDPCLAGTCSPGETNCILGCNRHPAGGIHSTCIR